MALVLAAAWAFLYWQSSSLDLAAVEAARSALAERQRESELGIEGVNEG